jgi:MerR family transcriptional regulator/heat shock protein HspR
MIQRQSRDTALYPIGTAARLLGVSVHTLRMHERKGLILPHHAETGYRLYSENDMERLRCIRTTINVYKVSIEGIKRVLTLIPCWAIMSCPQSDRGLCPAYSGHSEPCWNVRAKVPFCRNRACRECPVYTDLADCSRIKEKVRDLLNTYQPPQKSEL